MVHSPGQKVLQSWWGRRRFGGLRAASGRSDSSRAKSLAGSGPRMVTRQKKGQVSLSRTVHMLFPSEDKGGHTRLE